jgi:site-specific DNA recombinase
MTPSHARKAGIKYRYYLSSALLNGAPERVGSVARVSAGEIEAVVVKSVREHVKPQPALDDRTLIETQVERVEIHSNRLIIHLTQAPENDEQTTRPAKVLSVSWQKAASTRRREILIPEGTPPQQARRIRSENRATLVASIARARRWLTELITDPTERPESIAKREQCSVRKVNLTLSLAFLAPDLVKAAIDGALPHGMGVARLADLPAEWSRQRRILGLGSSL